MFILSLCLIHIIISLFNFPNYLQKYNLLQNDDELNFVKKELGQNQIKHIFTDRVNILWLKDLDANIYVNKDIEENYELISSDKDKNMVGVSAQEVEQVLPEAVQPAPVNDKYKTVQYEKLVPLLIEAIKDLNAEIEELKSINKKV